MVRREVRESSVVREAGGARQLFALRYECVRTSVSQRCDAPKRVREERAAGRAFKRVRK